MADKNRVEFGISMLHVGTYEVNESGVVTLGTPYHQKGTTLLSVEADSEQNDFYADNIKYWSGFSDNGFTGSITTAKFDTDFKLNFLGYVKLDDGGIANVKGQRKPDCYVAFQTEGDSESRRVLLLNAQFGAITREYATIEASKEPTTEALDITVVGDNATGITMVSYLPGDAGYDTLFTNPRVPSLPSESE